MEIEKKCCVCFKNYEKRKNFLRECIHCHIVVHEACYGNMLISKEMAKHSFECDTCVYAKSLSNTNAMNIQCVLCPCVNGALKKTTGNQWVHILCSLYIPEIDFADNGLIKIDKIPNNRFCKECHYCYTKGDVHILMYGACIECYKKNCSLKFHVTCAASANALHALSAKNNKLKYAWYCGLHIPKAKDSKEFHAKKTNCDIMSDVQAPTKAIAAVEPRASSTNETAVRQISEHARFQGSLPMSIERGDMSGDSNDTHKDGADRTYEPGTSSTNETAVTQISEDPLPMNTERSDSIGDSDDTLEDGTDHTYEPDEDEISTTDEEEISASEDESDYAAKGAKPKVRDIFTCLLEVFFIY